VIGGALFWHASEVIPAMKSTRKVFFAPKIKERENLTLEVLARGPLLILSRVTTDAFFES